MIVHPALTAVTSLPRLPAAPPDIPYAGDGQLVAACILGILAVVLLITLGKVHPFLSLMLGSAVLGAVATMPPGDIVASFLDGFGSTSGSVGVLIALGAMIGKLLEDSGGANRIVSTMVGSVGPGRLPWVMALIAAILGLPLFFEVGVVLLVPVILLVARRTGLSLMKLGIPALAGLSVLHGLVPPHPGPLTAIGLLNADLGRTLLYGIIIAIPTVVVAGPVLAHYVDRWVPKFVDADSRVLVPVGSGGSGADGASRAQAAERGGANRGGRGGVGVPDGPAPGNEGATPSDRGRGGAVAGFDDLEAPLDPGRRRVSFAAAIVGITLPVVLMLIDAIAKLLVTDKKSGVRTVIDFFGTPTVALLIAVLFCYIVLGLGSGMKKDQVSASVGASLPPIAAIILIVAAGGGFKQTLIDAGVGNVIKDWATGVNISVLLLGWLVAVLIRLGTGSATVATITAAGIVGPLAATLTTSHLALLVLAIGCGSLFFSHVNDAGFWLVKEYFGLTVGETIKSWSVMETVISVFGFALVMLLSLVV
ncbi:gluconate:H+ symporter, GntP family protein [Terrabacter tumescens]|uniref:Gluconate:H+ symporter, GntP family protein n=1 Tax=Terrabacter tumescens TaxID=60443 RepID=A0ABQ2HXJ2_9MICO|nr:SLC13 family permease [Terrabacter tumescens]GGM92706.1 gluconate:H+ symporter, GntP family protein [Terrabacter tumescens]